VDARRSDVSGWSVGEHVEHLLLADRWVLSWVERAIDEPERGSTDGGPTLPGRLVLLTGFIPRGRGTAPEATVPRGLVAIELADELVDLRRRVTDLGRCLEAIRVCRARLAHPVLGRLSAAEWLRFLAVHHRHHEKVVDEILSGV